MGQDLKGSAKNMLLVSMYTVFGGSLFFLIGCYAMKEFGFSLRFGLNTVHMPLLTSVYYCIKCNIHLHAECFELYHCK